MFCHTSRANARENKLAQQLHLVKLIAENPDIIDRLLISVTAKNENGKVKSLSKILDSQWKQIMFRLGKAWVLAFLKKPFSPKKNASTISETAVVAKTKPTSLKTDDVYVRNTSAIFETNVVTKRITPSKRKK